MTGEKGVLMFLRSSVRLVRAHTARCIKPGTKTLVTVTLLIILTPMAFLMQSSSSVKQSGSCGVPLFLRQIREDFVEPPCNTVCTSNPSYKLVDRTVIQPRFIQVHCALWPLPLNCMRSGLVVKKLLRFALC